MKTQKVEFNGEVYEITQTSDYTIKVVGRFGEVHHRNTLNEILTKAFIEADKTSVLPEKR